MDCNFTPGVKIRTYACRSRLRGKMVDIIFNLRVRIAAITASPAFDGMTEELQVTAFLTSFFVSGDGTILCLPFEGAPSEMSAYEDER